MSGFTPRAAQEEILAYRGGRMGVAAVPGSGKTLTIAALAATLAAELPAGSRVLVVTYQNAAVGALTRRISGQLAAMDRPRRGFEVRTLHGLAHAIIQEQPGLAGLAPDFGIVDEIAARDLLDRAILAWRGAQPGAWEAVLEEAQAGGGRKPSAAAVSRRLSGILATMISTAKNHGLEAEDLERRVAEARGAGEAEGALPPLLEVCAFVYRRYAEQLRTAGALDFDDLVRLAVALLDRQPELRGILGARWPYLLEDEAQDSVPLQEALLSRIAEGHAPVRGARGPSAGQAEAGPGASLQGGGLEKGAGESGSEGESVGTGESESVAAGESERVGENEAARPERSGGNWLRVGDPNQAITSSFTAADPRSLRRFLDAPETRAIEMDVSGRSAQPIIDLANHLLRWTRLEHPIPLVRSGAFRDQMIRPTPEGDPQRNPDAASSRIAFRAFRDRDQELADCLHRASAFAAARPALTLGILTPTNALGASLASRLRASGQPFDERLRSSAGSRRVAGALAALLAFSADPQDRGQLVKVYDALRELEPEGSALSAGDAERIRPLLRSCRPEQLLYPLRERGILDALPPVEGLEPATLEALAALAERLARWLRARSLPADQLALTLGREALPADDQPTVERIARLLRHRVDREPDRGLPALAAELEQLASGRAGGLVEDEGEGFEPRPGVITLSTMHRAKGLEWDLVYLLGADGDWLPYSLDEQRAGERAFAAAEQGRRAIIALAEARERPDLGEAEELARIETIQERMRLLYVGITRARLFLSISWSQGIPRPQGSPRPVPMSEAWRELKRFHEAGLAEERR